MSEIGGVRYSSTVESLSTRASPLQVGDCRPAPRHPIGFRSEGCLAGVSLPSCTVAWRMPHFMVIATASPVSMTYTRGRLVARLRRTYASVTRMEHPRLEGSDSTEKLPAGESTRWLHIEFGDPVPATLGRRQSASGRSGTMLVDPKSLRVIDKGLARRFAEPRCWSAACPTGPVPPHLGTRRKAAGDTTQTSCWWLTLSLFAGTCEARDLVRQAFQRIADDTPSTHGIGLMVRA